MNSISAEQKNMLLENAYKKHHDALIKLEKRYRSNNEILSCKEKGLSAPFLIKFSEESLNKTRRLLVVGQETYNCWYRTKTLVEDVDFIKDQMNEYSTFVKNESTQSQSPFWRSIKILKEKLLNTHAKNNIDFMWTNLCKYDYNGKRAPLDIQNEIYDAFTIDNHILLDEIKIYNPNVVIFMTGSKYDWYIQRIFKDTEDNLQQRSFTRLCSKDLPEHSYRTYHPNYLSRIKSLEATIMQIIQEYTATKKLS